MIDILRHILNALNGFAGLFSLLAVVAAIVVPIVIARKKRKEELQRLKDELEARESLHSAMFPAPFKDAITRETVIKNAIKRGEK